MKLTLKLFLASFIFLSVVSCKKTEGEKATTGEAEKVESAEGTAVNVNTETSLVKWVGTKPTGSHMGTVGLSEGSISVKDGKVTGGSFVLDMNSIKCTDLEGDEAAGLEGHLKGLDSDGADDFFNVNKYPTAKFEITKVSALMNNDEANSLVYGNLTMKDQTKSVGFKANITVDGGAVKVSAPQFTIDRTQWNINYGSKTVFTDLKDKFINDDIGLSIELSSI